MLKFENVIFIRIFSQPKIKLKNRGQMHKPLMSDTINSQNEQLNLK